MKSIVFIINTFTGHGGHYYSLVTTANALSKKYKVYIINVGEKVSPVIEESEIPNSFVYANHHNQLSVTRQIIKIIKKEKADVIHAFDYVAYIHAFFAAWKYNIPLVLTKCGGPVMPNLPYVNNLIVFTKEDNVFYNSVVDHEQTQIKLIPNRVKPFIQDKNRVESLMFQYGLFGKRIIIRIGRIDSFYYFTANQSIKLVKELHEFDNSFVLIVIGNVVDAQILEKMKYDALGCDFIHFVTDSKFTFNAKELLCMAEIVVGTGRGFMEACSLGKKMMAPNKGGKFPVLVTKENFEDVFYFNFSERYKNKKEKTSSEILRLINTRSEDSYQWFEKYFSYTMIEPLYTEFYNSLKQTNYRKIFQSIRKKLFIFWLSSFKNVK